MFTKKYNFLHTLARMLGSTATTSDKHFMALVLTAMALSPRTRKIYHTITINKNGVEIKYSCSQKAWSSLENIRLHLLVNVIN